MLIASLVPQEIATDIGALAFGLVVIQVFAGIIKNILAFAKNRAAASHEFDACAGYKDLQKQISEIDHRLSKLEGQLDI